MGEQLNRGVPIEVPFWGLTYDPKEALLDGVKVGRIYSDKSIHHREG